MGANSGAPVHLPLGRPPSVEILGVLVKLATFASQHCRGEAERDDLRRNHQRKEPSRGGALVKNPQGG